LQFSAKNSVMINRKKHPTLLNHLVALFSITLIFLSYSGINRLIAGDEGFYTVAARFITQGNWPYLDFFFPQMPLMPLILAGWFKLFGESWYTARIFSTFVTTLTSVFIWLLIYNTLKDCEIKSIKLALAYVGALLFLSSHLTFAWLTISKNYALTTLFLTLALYFQLKKDETKNELNKKVFLALTALALTLSFNTRLYTICLLPFHLYVNSKKDGRFALSLVLLYLLVCIIGSLPTLVLFLIDFKAFIFNNLSFHLNRSSNDPYINLSSKVDILKILFKLRPTKQFFGADFLILFLASSIAVFFNLHSNKHRKIIFYSYFTAIALFFVSYLPNPNYVQYFCIITPFLAVTMVVGFTILEPKRHLALTLFLLIATAFYTPNNLNLYNQGGVGTIGVSANLNIREKKIPYFVSITNELNKLYFSLAKNNNIRNFTVFALWSGYLLGCTPKLIPYKGTENHFTFRIAHKLSKEEQNNYHLFSRNDTLAVIAKGEPDILILGTNHSAGRYKEAISLGGYKLFKAVGGMGIFINQRLV
jgi:Dolichyl-phosphate-mannose-protein mannosyltransferase